MKSFQNTIKRITGIIIIWWLSYFIWQQILNHHNSPPTCSGCGAQLGWVFEEILLLIPLIIVVIPGYFYSLLPLPKEFFDISIFFFVGGGLYLILESIKRNSYESGLNSSSSFTSDSGSYSSSSSDDNSNGIFENIEDEQGSETNLAGSKSKCRDCWSKEEGRCKDCEGTGHDRTAEALVDFGSLGLIDGKIDCKICSGTGQCQSCGGTGSVFS